MKNKASLKLKFLKNSEIRFLWKVKGLNYIIIFSSYCIQYGRCHGFLGCDCDKTTTCTARDSTLTIQENNDENCPGVNGKDGQPGRS